MPDYIALIHEDEDGEFFVSFPDLPGVVTGGDTLAEAKEEAAEVLRYAAEDWRHGDHATPFPAPRSLAQLRDDPEFRQQAEGAEIVAIAFPPAGESAA